MGIALATPGCKKPPPAPPPPPTVKVIDVSTTSAAQNTEIIGQLDSPQNVEVRARVEAFVEAMPFQEGTEVKEGDQLVLLDKKPFLEQLAAANGRLAEAKAALNKYEKDVARLKPLAEKRAVPQQDLDNAIASVDVGNAAVLTAQARVSAAQLDLSYCDVRAPIAGLIGARQVSIGDFVGKGEPTLLATISMLDPIWFYCRVSEVDYLHADSEVRRTGKKLSELPVTLILSNEAEHPAKGKFVFFDRAVDPTTATLRARAEFPNPDKILRPGMFGRARIDLGTLPGSILIPERAITELQGKYFVWVINAENNSNQRAVKVGKSVGGDVMILEGLKPGERIVVEGMQKVREGALVQPVTAAETKEPASTPGSETPRTTE
jgi:membrane fusion protein (multidrug efflux system)